MLDLFVDSAQTVEAAVRVFGVPVCFAVGLLGSCLAVVGSVATRGRMVAVGITLVVAAVALTYIASQLVK